MRTVAYQKQLERVNGNAAAAEGDIASPHLTGATIDIAKQGLSRQEIGWMRAWLLPLEEAGKIDVEEEFQQSCFHITVYKSYVPPKPRCKPAAQARAAGGRRRTKATRGKPGRQDQGRTAKTGSSPAEQTRPPEAPEALIEGQ